MLLFTNKTHSLADKVVEKMYSSAGSKDTTP